MQRLATTLSLVVALALMALLQAQDKYRKPPKDIDEVLTTPLTPTVAISPTHDYLVIEKSERYPSIGEVAEPMLRLAGLRINPKNNGPHREARFVGLALKKIGGAEVKINAPVGGKLSSVPWSVDGKHFAFTNTT